MAETRRDSARLSSRRVINGSKSGIIAHAEYEGGHCMGGPLLSVDEVAEFLGVRPDTVYKLIRRNGLPGAKVGRLWRFRKDEVDGWVDEQRARRGPTKPRSGNAK
jgi:excisionase family DNA binding protein